MKLLVIIVVGLALLIGYIGQIQPGRKGEVLPTDSRPSEELTTQQDGIYYYKDDESGIILVRFGTDKQLSYFYETNQQSTISQYATQKRLTVAVNGGYFIGSYTQATHAGMLRLAGREITPLALRDPQLTHVVKVNQNNNIELVANSQYKVSREERFAFQSGPLLLNKGVVQNNYISGSLNGASSHRRTVLGMNASGERFFLVTTQPYSLYVLADWLQTHSAQVGQAVTAINLDGGMSTAIYTRDYRSTNYSTDWYLPNLLAF